MTHHQTASPSAPDGLAVVVVAAGSGTRLGYGMPKALVPVNGRSVLEHALAAVRRAVPGATTIVTVPAGDTDLTALARAAGASPVVGGATRAQSVARALATLPETVTHVLVHDAARCLTPPAVFERVVTALRTGAPAVVPVTEVTDTVRGVDTEGRSTGTVDRAGLRCVQTPQGFDRALLDRVNAAAGLLPDRGEGDPAGITDDASLVERFAPEHPVTLVAGDVESFKITRPLDLVLARALVNSRG
ncbi:2-C-methyl-D-erythritol 4-phosphate cytidylyltransferase [Kocuria tytonis]|uniref:2-C-methyl-D-erythritol 4-phosphate cytidylyltransferase n=1 Tax=Kocuria tytonis TaxID=2054280 RepID=A0A495A2E3_9MICC|nr:2-C-methyl-D-erythritol 4-phosphate cytidylyltransferase [Kocuria tytonis]RKQ33619.1 2-C-methyl-D-erythritol 4-phosphate cytidylyltransferase [Kocuria tytonis]